MCEQHIKRNYCVSYSVSYIDYIIYLIDPRQDILEIWNIIMQRIYNNKKCQIQIKLIPLS